MHIRLDEIAATPWANGRGVTRELAVERAGDQVAWRISVAEIEKDGPFSCFPGMARVHTIIEGAGLDLHGTDEVLNARPCAPLPFDGTLALNARLLDGPCRAFNVIYDPKITKVSVDVLAVAQSIDVTAGAFVFVASGAVTADSLRLEAGDAIRPDGAVTLAPAPDAKVLHVRFAAAPA